MSIDLPAQRCSVSCFEDCLVPPAKPTGRSPPDDPIATMGTLVRYPRGAEIFGQNQPAEYLYLIVTGAVRTFRILNDGRRQICAFYLPGDYFGIEPGDQHASYAFAINDVQAIAVGRQMVAKRAGRRRDVARQLLAIRGKEIQNLQDQTLLLTKTAEERIAWFMLQMAHRTTSSSTVSLPMPRRDIADYLGVTVETISRTLGQLETAGWIESISPRRIQLKNRAALTRLVS